MNSQILESKWNLLKGEIKRQWGDLTDDEITKMRGKADILVAKLQEKFAYSQEEAREKVNKFLEEWS